MKKSNILVNAVLFIAAVAIVVSCAVNPVTGKRQLMLMSEAQEVALGFI